MIRGERVLLTGVVAERGKADDAARLMREVLGVRKVYNEIESTSQISSFTDCSRDVWIASQLKIWLLLDTNITCGNYAIDVINSTVYLIGIARD